MKIGMLTAGCAAIAFGLTGCGSSGSATSTTTAQDAGAAVVRAADVTGATSGYRFTGKIAITGPATISDTMHGTILSASKTGEVELHQRLLGHSMTIAERFHDKTFWVSATGIPDASKLTNKPWLKYDIASTMDELGVGGMPSGSSNPSEILSYLKSVGGNAHKLGTERIRGVQTTHYAATVNLHDYVRAVPAAQRAQARKAVARLISTIGSDELHLQVWIDDHHLARQISMSLAECVARQHLKLSVTVDMYDFGTHANVTLPSDSESYDITPLVNQALAHQKLGCTATS
jgi:hypothetical protein